TYPFEKRRCWIESGARSEPALPTATAFSQDAGLQTAMHPRPTVPVAYVAPASDVERALAAIWEELLGIVTIGVHDNFFDLGGHSLLLTRLISRLRERFDIDVPLHDVFRASTIAELADVITAQLLAEVEQMSEDEARRQIE